MSCEGRIQVQPLCCCPVAYEGGNAFLQSDCFRGPYTTHALSLSLAELIKYRLLFLGPDSLCSQEDCGGDYYRYSTLVSTKIKSWVEAGGRLWCAAEWIGCFDQHTCFKNETDPPCRYTCTSTPNMDRFNNFLGFLGTGMQMTFSPSCGCDNFCLDNKGRMANEPIVTGLPDDRVIHSNVGNVAGGRQLCFISGRNNPPECRSTTCFLSAERVGKGVVFAAMDSNMTTCCANDQNCELFKRVCEWKIDNMFA